MSASLIGRLESSAFRLSAAAVDVSHGIVLLFGIGTKALPLWDSRTRWNNLMGGLAVKATAGPSGHANSPHPSSREGHHSTAGWISSVLLIEFDPVRPSCRYDLPGPAERGAVNPDAVHDHRQAARQGHDRLFHAAAPSDLHGPGLEPGPRCRTHQHALSGFVEHGPHHLIAAARYSAAAFALARLILGARQPKHRPD